MVCSFNMCSLLVFAPLCCNMYRTDNVTMHLIKQCCWLWNFTTMSARKNCYQMCMKWIAWSIQRHQPFKLIVCKLTICDHSVHHYKSQQVPYQTNIIPLVYVLQTTSVKWPCFVVGSTVLKRMVFWLQTFNNDNHFCTLYQRLSIILQTEIARFFV